MVGLAPAGKISYNFSLFVCVSAWMSVFVALFKCNLQFDWYSFQQIFPMLRILIQTKNGIHFD